MERSPIFVERASTRIDDVSIGYVTAIFWFLFLCFAPRDGIRFPLDRRIRVGYVSPPMDLSLLCAFVLPWFVIYDTYLTTYNDPTSAVTFVSPFISSFICACRRRSSPIGVVCLPHSGCDDFFTYCINQRRLFYPLSVCLFARLYPVIRLTG